MLFTGVFWIDEEWLKQQHGNLSSDFDASPDSAIAVADMMVTCEIPEEEPLRTSDGRVPSRVSKTRPLGAFFGEARSLEAR